MLSLALGAKIARGGMWQDLFILTLDHPLCGRDAHTRYLEAAFRSEGANWRAQGSQIFTLPHPHRHNTPWGRKTRG
jgi:hypothetical protein